MGIHHGLNRRTVLRGMMGGTAISVGLPFLDLFLNDHGTALANGAALPPCFGVWYQGLGFNPGRWEPAKVGANYDMGPDLQMLTPFKDRINIYSGLRSFIDANPFNPHFSGTQAILQGALAKGGVVADMGLGDNGSKAPSVDQLIADAIGTRARFRSLEVGCDGSPASNSRRSASAINSGSVGSGKKIDSEAVSRASTAGPAGLSAQATSQRFRSCSTVQAACGLGEGRTSRGSPRFLCWTSWCWTLRGGACGGTSGGDRGQRLEGIRRT